MKIRFSDDFLKLDLRSLGLFRILLAFVLILNWFTLWPDLEAFFTSFGILPVDAVTPEGISLAKSGGIFHFSILDAASTLWEVRTLFLLGLLAYLSLLVGFQTRLAHFLSFIFYLSVESRNPLIHDAGDTALELMLMWSLFLPLGARYSLDSLLRKMGLEPAVSPLATFAIIFQIASIYFFSAYAKSGGTWLNGTAVYFAMSSDQFARPLGHWLSLQPLWLLKGLTWGVLVLECAVVPLLLFPLGQPRLRKIAAGIMFLLQLGIQMTLSIGTFQLTMMSLCVLFLSKEEWALLGRAWTALRRWVNFLPMKKEGKPGVVPFPPFSSSSPQVRHPWNPSLLNLGTNSVIVLILSAITLNSYYLNVTSKVEGTEAAWARHDQEPVVLRAVVQFLQLDRNWHLFAPSPSSDNGWWVMDGETFSGGRLDPLTGGEPNFGKPARLSSRYDKFWLMCLRRLAEKRYAAYRPYFARYISRKNWLDSTDPGSRLARFRFYYVLDRIPPPGSGQPSTAKPILLLEDECLPPVGSGGAVRKGSRGDQGQAGKNEEDGGGEESFDLK